MALNRSSTKNRCQVIPSLRPKMHSTCSKFQAHLELKELAPALLFRSGSIDFDSQLTSRIVALSEYDRDLLKRCIAGEPHAWEDFVDRFLGLVIHVIDHTTSTRSIAVDNEDKEDLAAEVFLTIVSDDYAVLRRFRGQSSLATYLTVVSRRVVVRDLLRRRAPEAKLGAIPEESLAEQNDLFQRINDKEEVQRMIEGLSETEADVVRLFHLEGLTYQEISDALRIPENSIGPTLTRARAKMRDLSVES